MSIALEPEYVVQAAYARLAADAQLNTTLGLAQRIYRDLAPQGAAYPNVVLSVVAAVDLNTLDGTHVWSDTQLQAKTIGQFRGVAMSYAALRAIAERVAVLLQGFTATVSGVYVVKFRRIAAPAQPPDDREGVRYAYLNQVFQTEAMPAS